MRKVESVLYVTKHSGPLLDIDLDRADGLDCLKHTLHCVRELDKREAVDIHGTVELASELIRMAYGLICSSSHDVVPRGSLAVRTVL